MSSPRPSKPIPFDLVKKLEEKGNLDLSATLGALIKEIYNRHPSETLQGNHKIKIRGNLRVSLRLSGDNLMVEIVSDDPTDPVRLQWLRPWFSVSMLENGVTTYDLWEFDENFVQPYLEEFRAHLDGKHPMEVLYLALETGHPMIQKTIAEFKSWEKTAQLKKGSLVETLMVEYWVSRKLSRAFHAVESFFITKEESVVSINLDLLTLLAAIYRGQERCVHFNSIFEPYRNEIVKYIVENVLPKLKAKYLLMEYVPLHGVEYVGPTQFHNLLILMDLDIVNALLDKMREAHVDLNKLDNLPHTLEWLSLQWINSRVSLQTRPIIYALMDAGATLTEYVSDDFKKIYTSRSLKSDPEIKFSVTDEKQEPVTEDKQTDCVSQSLKKYQKQFSCDLQTQFIRSLSISLTTTIIIKGEVEFQEEFICWAAKLYIDICHDLNYDKSLYAGFTKIISDEIVNVVLPSLRVRDLTKDTIRSLLKMPDRNIFNCLAAKLRSRDVLLQSMCEDYEFVNFADDTNFALYQFLPPDEQQWFMRRMCEEGIEIKPEIVQQLEAVYRVHEDAVELFLKVFLAHYAAVFVKVQTLLPRDPAGVVMRYLFGDQFVNSAMNVSKESQSNGRLAGAFFAKPNMQASTSVGFREERLQRHWVNLSG